MNKTIWNLNRQVRAVIEEAKIEKKLLVVAVSGGPDSLAMLHALHHLQDEMQFQLHGAHLNHGLRGDESEMDARVVAETFRRLSISFTLEKVNVRFYQKNHRLSLEEAARDVRYAFLSKVAAKRNTDVIAVGHTSDDQVETVFMNIMRGSGLSGLRGMETSAHRTFGRNKIVVVRPLLGVSRRDTMEYCRILDIEPRQDRSNRSLRVRRNRVRLELLPELEKYNPAIREALLRLSRSATQDLSFIERQVDKAWYSLKPLTGEGVSLDRSIFIQMEPTVQSYVLRRAVLAVKGDLRDVDQNHIADMVRLTCGSTGKSLNLPGNICFSVGYEMVTISPSSYQSCPLPLFKGEHRLKVPGETVLPGWSVSANFLDAFQPDSEISDISDYTAYFDSNSLGSTLWVRSRIPGERIQPLGMSQTKKLQDFMVDSKIPRDWRNRVPLVVSPRGVAWVVGWRIAEWGKVYDNTTQRLRIKFLMV